MASALTVIVLGQGLIFSAVPNPALNGSNFMKIENMDRTLPQIERRREGFTYTPGVGGHKLHIQATTWEKARIICEEEGGHLAIINSLLESDVIATLIAKGGEHIDSEDPNYALIGFHTMDSTNQYVTVHGDPLVNTGYTEWNDSEPTRGDDENCGSVYHNGKLNDIICSSPYAFICEVPYVEL